MDTVLVNAEVTRFICEVIDKYSADPAKYPAAQLRTDIIKDLKALRTTTKKKEKDIVPAPVLQKCLQTVWAA